MADGSLHKAAAEMHLPQDAARRDLITELNTARSPLLRLPAEIRNAIYTYVFGDQVYTYKWRTGHFSIICEAEYPCLGLLLASRQVHHESALLPYKFATFVWEVSSPWLPEDAKIFFAKRSEAQIAALGRMEVIFCKKRWNGSGSAFLKELDDLLSEDYVKHWSDI